MSGYGSLKRPASAHPSVGERATIAPMEKVPMQIDDPRHASESPMPWLRYFFPSDFNLREGTEDGCFYQHFDVGPAEHQEDITVPPPSWALNAYFRLSFAQKDVVSKLSEDVKGRVPTPAGQSPFDSIDFTKDNWPIYAEGAETHMRNVIRFCRSVGTFRAKTWKDAFPLNDLQRGIILYLLEQIPKGQKLSVEYARRDAFKVVEEERARRAQDIAAALAKAKAEWEVELQRQLKEREASTRKEVSGEMQLKTKELISELNEYKSKCIEQESAIARLNEISNKFQRLNERLISELEESKIAHTRSLGDQSALTRAHSSLIKDLESALERSKKCILEALEAGGDKDKIISVVTSAASLSVPGAHAYLAELMHREDLSLPSGSHGPLLSHALEAVALIEAPDGENEGEGEEGDDFSHGPRSVIRSTPMTDVIMSIKPGFLYSPFDENFPFDDALGGNAKDEKEETKPPAEGEGEGEDEHGRQLVLKYIVASPGQDFMVGQVLPFGTGVSWTPIMQQEEAAKDAREKNGGDEGEDGIKAQSMNLTSFFEALDGHLKANKVKFADLLNDFDGDGKGGLNQNELIKLICQVMPSASFLDGKHLAKLMNPDGALSIVTVSHILSLAKETFSKKDEAGGADLEMNSNSNSATPNLEGRIFGNVGGLPPHLLLSDISEQEGVHFFKGASVSALSSRGSLLAVPLLGLRGHVVGLLAVDTMVAASSAAALRAVAAHGGHGESFSNGQLGSQAAGWVGLLAHLASRAIQKDQRMLEEAVLKAQLMSKSSPELGVKPGSSNEYDPELYYLDSDKAKFKATSDSLVQITDEELENLQSIVSPEPSSIAIVRSVLAVAGQESEGGWDEINRSLLERLGQETDPASRFNWTQICKLLRSLFEAETERGSKTDPQVRDEKGASQALGRWVVAVRAIVARKAVVDGLGEKLAIANEALMVAFSGERGTGALSELRSYRVCPKISNAVLTVLLLIAGYTAEDCEGWGRMKALVSYKMIKRLADVKPQDADRQVLRQCIKCVKSVDEQEVKKESLATFTLFKWLENFAKLSSLVLKQ